MSLIEESLGFSAFRHYAVQTRLKQSVDQSDFKKKTLNDWNIMSLTTKQLFVNQTPLKNQNQELCLCRKTYNVTTETSPMVACDLCKEWYHNNCIGLESAFTHAFPFFYLRSMHQPSLLWFHPIPSFKYQRLLQWKSKNSGADFQ